MITKGLNGAEVESSKILHAMHPDHGYLHESADVSVESALKLAEKGVYFKVVVESVCQECGTVVESPEGHESDACREASRGE